MTVHYPYDAAISCVAEDALTARYLIERLRERLGAPIFESPLVSAEHAADDGGELPAAVVLGARVIIVLHQRLWGDTPSTRLDRCAIEQRVAREGCGFLVVVTLEHEAELPPCLAHGVARVRLSADGEREVDVIAEAIRRAGGTPGNAPSHGAADDEHEAMHEAMHEAPHSAAKEAQAAQREWNAVIGEIEAHIKAVPTVSPDIACRVRRAPDRCVVQAGDIGLSISWLPPGAANAEGTLLVLEWTGTITMPGEPVDPRRRATVVSEHVLHLEAAPGPWRNGGPSLWNWWSDGAPMRKYSSRDLAALCVRQLVQRLETAQEA
jgi:hypothetical protein